jgi:hypothetical protein
MTRHLAAFAFAATLLAARDAAAFCGFYVSGADSKLFNDATNVVLMRDGTRTVLSMQNAYKGPPEAFAMVVPVPVVLHKENVKTLARAVFDRVDQLAAPRLVEYWEEDPCAPLIETVAKMAPMGAAKSGGAVHSAPQDYGVKIEAAFAVAEYDVVVLSAEDSSGLERWLADNHYAIPAGSEPYLRPYVQGGSKFFVAKVDPAKVVFEDGRAMLSPLRFHYDSDSFALPIRLGLVNSGGVQDLVVNILAKSRYEAANYPNVTIPTNLDVAESARSQFGGFYAALFDATIERNPRAVVTEYAWDSGSCDPCPVPALAEGEIQTLGGDVVPNVHAYGLVLTRLHARYAKDSLGEDIVFRPAPAIEGGREWLASPSPGPASAGRPANESSGLEKGAKPSSTNNFQARYAIRHPWTGAVTCANPRFGHWGGPPGSRPWDPPPPPSPVSRVAFAPRGAVKLASVVRDDVPELGLRSAQGAPSPERPAPRDASAAGVVPALGTGALLGGMGTLAVAGLLLSQRKRRR